MRQRLYILRFTDNDNIVFKYDKQTGNPKKALFSMVDHANSAAEKLNNNGVKVVYVDCID